MNGKRIVLLNFLKDPQCSNCQAFSLLFLISHITCFLRFQMVLYKIASAVEVPMDMLKFSGVWPYENPSLWYLVRTLMSYAITMSLLALITFEALISLRDIFSLSNILLLGFEYLAYAVKLVVFHFERVKVHSLSRIIEGPLLNSYDERHNAFVKNAITRTTFIANAFKVSCVLTTSFLGLRPFIGHTIFPVPFSFFQEGFMWYIIYLVQVIGLAVGKHSLI